MAYIILNKSNFFNNLDVIAKKTKSKDKIALVLKDNAYGHGILEVASMAQEYGIKRAVVQLSKEAKKIEQYFEYILVLADFPEIASEKIRYTINDINTIEKFSSGTNVELKVDTGMHRHGIKMDQLHDALKRIKKQNLHLEAVFTHHGSADEETDMFTTQNKNFEKIKVEVNNLGYTDIRFHSCNSAALFRTKDFNEDMARVGIAAYGYLELTSTLTKIELRPVLSVYANVISTRELQKGEAVGYGATFVAEQDCVVSSYDFGYGDGFLRGCSNNYTSPKGLELAGRISMDNSSFVSSEKNILIFNDARVVAKSAKTISYEVLTSLKSDLKREII
ncbi:MAG: alanine racemase [Sulfurimonas sp.]|jgi:alanine racemase|uniref:alanine racemase n=1 Tax=Sulfurimonas sp. TaxID=2022749 RepID=UPI0039E28E99